MFRRPAAMGPAAPSSDNEVSVQKVDKIDLVFNLVTKPTVYGYGGGTAAAGAAKRPAAATGGGDHGSVRKPAAAGGGATTASRFIVSIEDINKRSENYIREKKRLFLGQK